MQKFIDYPIGLGFNHLEHETAAAYIWNDLIDKGLPPNTLWECSPVRLENISYPLSSGSMLDMEIIIKDGDLYRFSDWAIEKIQKFLNEKNGE
jgi:hypothetical protein